MSEALATATEPQTTEGDTFAEAINDIREQIVDLLTSFPYVSRSMIQVGIGPAQSPKIWGPILEALKSDGTVTEQQVSVTTPKGRSLTRVIYHLSTMPYPPITLGDIDDRESK